MKATKRNGKSKDNAALHFDRDPVPPVTRLNLVYSASRTLTASLNEAVWEFTVNNLFDPDYTFTGSQPDYFDEWCALYTYVRCLGCKVEVKACSPSSRMKIAMAPATSTQSAKTTDEVAGWRNSVESDFNQGGPLARMVSVMSVGKTWGQPLKSVISDDSYQGTNTTAPVRKLFATIHANTAGASDTVWCSVRLTFDVRFESPKMVALSATRHLTSSALVADREKQLEAELTELKRQLTQLSLALTGLSSRPREIGEAPA